MVRVEDWAEIRRLYRAEGLSARAVARELGISRGTVLRALASDRPPVYRRAPKGSAVDAVEPAIRELLKQTPTMPATVIAERIGWERGLSILRERVRELRPAYLPADPVSRTVYQPGELAQCDLWFPPVDIPLGYGQSGRPPVLVIVSGYSRMITARMVPSRTTGDLIDGHWRLLSNWGAVPRTLVWDNETGVGKGKLTSEFAAFAGLLAVSIHLCRPRDPEAKGLVERANGYLETSFVPGRLFTGPDDFNRQLTSWLQVANRRHHRSIDARPADRWEADRAQMLTIPPVAPPHWWPLRIRIGRDHYIRVDTNDYSVHPRAIGRTVMVHADNEEITVTCGEEIVARHPRCWARHQSLTDPDHAAAADLMRGEVIHQQAARAATARASTFLSIPVARTRASRTAAWTCRGRGRALRNSPPLLAERNVGFPVLGPHWCAGRCGCVGWSRRIRALHHGVGRAHGWTEGHVDDGVDGRVALVQNMVVLGHSPGGGVLAFTQGHCRRTQSYGWTTSLLGWLM